MKKLVILLVLSFLAISCQKENLEKCLSFDKDGGVMTFSGVSLDGNAMNLQTSGKVVHGRYYDFVNDEEGYDMDWVADGVWVRVYYNVSRACLYVFVDENDSGLKRTAILTFTSVMEPGGDKTSATKTSTYEIKQAK